MNKFSNGTLIVGSFGSYQFLLSGMTDLLKRKPKVFEVYHLSEVLKKEGLRIGLSKEKIQTDFNNCHN